MRAMMMMKLLEKLFMVMWEIIYIFTHLISLLYELANFYNNNFLPLTKCENLTMSHRRRSQGCEKMMRNSNSFVNLWYLCNFALKFKIQLRHWCHDHRIYKSRRFSNSISVFASSTWQSLTSHVDADEMRENEGEEKKKLRNQNHKSKSKQKKNETKMREAKKHEKIIKNIKSRHIFFISYLLHFWRDLRASMPFSHSRVVLRVNPMWNR